MFEQFDGFEGTNNGFSADVGLPDYLVYAMLIHAMDARYPTALGAQLCTDKRRFERI